MSLFNKKWFSRVTESVSALLNDQKPTLADIVVVFLPAEE